jgi:hypothetical protein
MLICTPALVMVLTTAGSETTATTLCGAINKLIAHPDKLSRLAEETRAIFRNREQITLESLKNLPYLNAVIHESLRLCPAIPWVLSRLVPVGGDTVCGTWLPGGVCSKLYSYVQMHNLTDTVYRHQYLSKHTLLTVIRNISTIPRPSNPSDGYPTPLPIPILHTFTINDKPFNLLAWAHAVVWVSTLHGPRCALYFQNYCLRLILKQSKARRFAGRTSEHSCLWKSSLYMFELSHE